MKNKLDKKTKRRKGWIKDLTEYERSIFVNMLSEAAMIKRRWVNKKEKREVIYRFRDIVRAIRDANRINESKDSIVSEQKRASELNSITSDIIKVKKKEYPE